LEEKNKLPLIAAIEALSPGYRVKKSKITVSADYIHEKSSLSIYFNRFSSQGRMDGQAGCLFVDLAGRNQLVPILLDYPRIYC
jgi:hypothetical protein